MQGSRLRRSISTYLATLETKGLAHDYITAVKSTLRAFRIYCEDREIGCLRRVTPELVRDFLIGYQIYSASYRRGTHSHLRRYLDYFDNRAMKDLYLPIRGDDSRRNVSWLNREEAERLYNLIMTPGACSDEQILLVGAGLLQCARRIETLRLTFGEAREALKARSIRLYAKHKTRLVVLQEEFGQILEHYLERHNGRDEELLINFKRTRSEELLQRVSATFGVHLTFHKLRRTGLTLMFEDAGETDQALRHVSTFAGHASTEMTRKYLCLDMKAQKTVVSRYHLSRDHPVPGFGAPGPAR